MTETERIAQGDLYTREEKAAVLFALVEGPDPDRDPIGYLKGEAALIAGLGERVLAKSLVYQKGTTFREAETRLLSLLNEGEPTILHNRSGDDARLSKSSIGKLLSNAAVRKSIDNGFTREQHYAVAAILESGYIYQIFRRRPDCA
jgi:hypothetical protein